MNVPLVVALLSCFRAIQYYSFGLCVCVCDLDLGRWLFVSFPEANIQRVRQMGRCSSDVTRSYPAGCNVEIHRVADQIVSGRWRSFGLAKVIPMVSVPLWKVPVALPRWRFCGCPAMIDLGQRMNPWLSKFIFLVSTNTPGYRSHVPGYLVCLDLTVVVIFVLGAQWFYCSETNRFHRESCV
jgi:hypothetical protein